MLILCRNVGESVVVQRTPDTITRIKVIRVERPTVVLSVETRTLDGRLTESRELRLLESA
ncbi:hypothetical protein [Pseudomonas sp. LFM046]|uniref:hypothetical protein n=1 Tax=Pseudomonas sp. LFM046 TaxID=1608357 RepID=UPI0005CFC34B|nr:hypothetical protein [Pseudomonas sp. LFM046]